HLLRVGEPVVVAVEDDQVHGQADLRQRAGAREPEGGHDPDPVDLGRLRVPDRVPEGPAPQPRHHGPACGGREQLGVAHPRGGAAAGLVDDDDPDADRAGECATADLVHAGKHPVALPLQLPLQAQAGARGAGGARGRCHRVSVSARAWDPAGGTSEKTVSWESIIEIRSSGQILTKALPTTRSIGTEPSLPVPSGSWKRESEDSPRLSPMTHRCPSGTTTLNSTSLGFDPGRM